MQTEAYAKAVVLDQDNRVLLIRRSPTDDKRPGDQDFPGGGLEPGEDFMAGMSREILEEIGLKVKVEDLKLFYAATTAYEDRSVTRLVFWVRVPNDVVIKLSYEHDDYHWVPAEKVYDEFPHPVYGTAVNFGLEHKLFTNPDRG